MKSLHLLTLVLFLFLSGGCASTYKLDPMESSGQTTNWSQGVPVLVSKQGSTIVAVKPSEKSFTSDSRPSFVVQVINNGDSSFLFSTKNINVLTDIGNITVYTAEELMAEQESDRKMAMFGMALAGASAALQTISPPTTPQIVTPQQQMASFETRKEVSENSMEQISKTILAKTTVLPGKSYGGFITIGQIESPERHSTLKMEVGAGKDVHNFNFKLNTDKN